MTSAADVLLVHGYTGSGPEHWQTWLAGELAAPGREVAFPQLPDDADPELEAWLAALAGAQLASDAVVLAHSLGCWLWAHAVQRGLMPAVARTLLVAPPSPLSRRCALSAVSAGRKQH